MWGAIKKSNDVGGPVNALYLAHAYFPVMMFEISLNRAGKIPTPIKHEKDFNMPSKKYMHIYDGKDKVTPLSWDEILRKFLTTLKQEQFVECLLQLFTFNFDLCYNRFMIYFLIKLKF